MTRIASLVSCALMLGLFVISQSFSSPNGAPQNPAPAGLEEEIKRVEAEIEGLAIIRNKVAGRRRLGVRQARAASGR